MTYTYQNSAKKLVALGFVFVLMAGFLIKLGLDGNRLVPPEMNEPIMRFTCVFFPFALVGVTVISYLYLLVSQLNRRLEVGSLGVTLVSGAKSVTVGWAAMVVGRTQSTTMLASSLISDGKHQIRLQRFFWPDHDDILNRIERTIKHNRTAKTVKVEV